MLINLDVDLFCFDCDSYENLCLEGAEEVVLIS